MRMKNQRNKFLQWLLVAMLGILFTCTPAVYADSADHMNSVTDNAQSGLSAKGELSSDEESESNLLLTLSSASNKEQDALPANVLTNELLYQILSADIADQRGFDAYAYKTMLTAAKETKDPRLAQRAVEIAIKKKNIKEALQAGRLWHKLAPRSDKAEKYLLVFFALDNRLSEIKDYFSSKLASTTPEKRVALFYQLQRVLSGVKDKSDAFAVMEEITAPYQNTLEAHISLAIMASLKKDRARAKEEAQKALALKPDSEMAVLTYAQLSGDTHEAIAILSAFLKQNPHSREVRLSLARLLIGQKKYEQAKQEFKRLLNEDPQNVMALYSLGLLAIQDSDYVSAENYFKTYLETPLAQSSENQQAVVQVLFFLSQIAEEQHQYDKAFQWLSQIKLDEDDEIILEVQVRRAQLYAQKGAIDKARKIIADLINENPYEREKLLLAEARILREVKRTKEAFEVLKAGYKQFPKSTNMLYDYALTAESLGHYALMEELLRQIIKIDPNHQQAYNALGYSFADRNIRLDEAYALIHKAIKLAPDDPYITDSLGWVLFRQGKLDLAEQFLRRAYEMQPDTEITVHLAEVLWITGHQQEALGLFSQVKKKDPHNDVFNSTLMRLKIKL